MKNYYLVSCKNDFIIERPDDYQAAALYTPVIHRAPIRCHVFVVLAESSAAAEDWCRAYYGYSWVRASRHPIDEYDLSYARARGVPFIECR